MIYLAKIIMYIVKKNTHIYTLLTIQLKINLIAHKNSPYLLIKN